ETTFALEEATGDLSGSVGLLHVLTGEGEEIETGALRARDCGDEDLAPPEGQEDGAVGLFGQAPGFEGELAAADGDGFTYKHVSCAPCAVLGCCGQPAAGETPDTSSSVPTCGV